MNQTSFEEMSIHSQSKNAMAWSITDKFLKRGIQFVLSIILARLLTPDDFGIVAMASIFVSWGDVFRDFGLGQSIVQQKNVTDVQTSTIFYLNVTMGVVIALIFLALAPLAAEFYNNEMVAWVVRVSGLTFIIQSFNVVQHSLLQKQLNFKIGTIASFLSTLLSGIIGIILAFEGFGVWSLLIQGVASCVISTIYIWIRTTWRPKLLFNFKETKPMFKKGIGFMMQGLVDNVFSSLGTMAIGKLFSPSILGLYSRGFSLAEMPKNSLVTPIIRPLFPAFAKIQDKEKELQSYFLKTTEFLNWTMILITGIILCSSNEIICILYGDAWVESAKYLFILSCTIPFFPLWTTATSLWKGLGHVKKVVLFTFIEKLLAFLSIAGLFYNLELYAILLVVTYVIASVIKSIVNVRIVGLSLYRQYKEWTIETIIIIAVVLCFCFVEIEPMIVSLLLKTLVMISVYVIISRILNLDGYNSTINQVKILMAKFRKRNS